MHKPGISVKIDLGVIRRNTQAIARQVNVPICAVIKADAYGLGAARVAQAIGDLVAGFCVFGLAEALRDSLWERCGKPILSLGPSTGFDASEFQAAHVNPSVWTVDEAARLAGALPALCVDTGMQRFSCPADQVEAVLAAGNCRQAFTHAARVEHAIRLSEILGGRGIRLHAAGSSLLDEPKAWLDAVRPGIALYRGAARISTILLEVRKAAGPVGYWQFTADRFGVIFGGYSHGLRRGPVLINGQRRAILEVGMQSSFVETGDQGRAGDEVILLGGGLRESDLAKDWQTSEQEVLVCLARAADRKYCAES
jgi:alanine racemase